ncbi:DNA polymerase III subunit chi [Pseudomonas sp. A-1]|uniref:DNA polymerase III subunit chi n=1 Tax=Pseudomonas sp. A-1 TaxID=1821274 RepID=UPI0010A5AE17|nr:DNA polymerase III subunit chi [Pseudomonas sp. A-1]THG79770.1 DNA polymerase III subunit chi [Pseudomonas sp. A-1]
MDTPPKPTHLPDWASDELPLLTETVDEPAIPLLSDPLPEAPLLREPTLREPQLAEPPESLPPAAGREQPLPTLRPAGDALRHEPLAQIERELHAAAQLIMQEVIDDYMLQIEAELHRRLEEHLASILRAGRR